MSTDVVIEPHSECIPEIRSVLNESSLAVGLDYHADYTITETPPVFRTQWTDYFICPHGVVIWVEPTTDQRARWVKDKTP